MLFFFLIVSAPEIFAGNGYDHAVDWYSLGILAMRMINNNQVSKIAAHVNLILNFSRSQTDG